MSVQTKIENYLNYITGSGGGWPSKYQYWYFGWCRLHKRRNQR